MTMPGPTPPNWTPPQPARDNSSRALKLSGAALIWTIIGVIALCLAGPFLCCSAGIIGGAGRDRPTITPAP
jgi:hypothetical protein